MADAAVAALSPETVLGEMKKNGVTHVVWLPDSETNWLYLLMKAEPSLRLVGVSRAYISYLEKGHGEPSLGTLRKIARVTKTSLSDLVGA